MIYALIFIIGFLIGYCFKYPKDTKKDYTFSFYMCSPPTKPMKNRIPPKGGSGAMISKKCNQDKRFQKLHIKINIRGLK